MAALTGEQAQADIARLGARVGDQEAHAKGARRRRMLRGIGAAIRDADDLIARIGAADLLSEADRLHLIGECRAVRTALHDQIRTLSYEAWFWTEAWQAGEREAEAQIAAGQGTQCESDEALFAYLDRLTGDNAHL